MTVDLSSIFPLFLPSIPPLLIRFPCFSKSLFFLFSFYFYSYSFFSSCVASISFFSCACTFAKKGPQRDSTHCWFNF
jgi:hypothetical protein